jgi:hypothetical protein
MLQLVIMPIKNFFLSSSLTSTCSSRYPFLYTICKIPLSSYMTGTLLNCNHGPLTSTLLNCQPSQDPLSSTTLNYRLTQTMHDMPSGHVRHLGHLRHLRHLRRWTYSGIPSGPYVILGHLRQLGHPSHLGHLGHLGNISDLNTLNPYPLEPAPTDSQLEAFITELDPTDLGPSKGYYKDDLLNPLSIDTPLLLPCLNRHYTSQALAPSWSRTYTSQTHGQSLDPSDFPLDALDGHGSFLEIP